MVGYISEDSDAETATSVESAATGVSDLFDDSSCALEDFSVS